MAAKRLYYFKSPLNKETVGHEGNTPGFLMYSHSKNALAIFKPERSLERLLLRFYE